MELKSEIACIWRLLEQYTRYQLRELLNKETQISLLAIIRTRELRLEDWFTHLETKPVPKPSFYSGISGPLLYFTGILGPRFMSQTLVCTSAPRICYLNWPLVQIRRFSGPLGFPMCNYREFRQLTLMIYYCSEY
ncbi:hypothetical protein CEXT_7631 [Caerostris extrusa]|uniref:Uncharacterized protein n=1 Tax=Caerostris extrusa TaxID=172846 RepID=A0AAV4XQ30_CAEEX|nr:hypothetical protein CEXT_7631 [Caerostris extrusa]